MVREQHRESIIEIDMYFLSFFTDQNLLLQIVKVNKRGGEDQLWNCDINNHREPTQAGGCSTSSPSN